MKKKLKTKPVVNSAIIADSPIIIAPKKKFKKRFKKRSTPPIVTPVIAPIVESAPPITVAQVVKEDTNKIKPNVVVFYGHKIRSTFMNSQWYFSLEDIVKLCNIVDPTKFLIDLKSQSEVKEIYYKIVETFSYYENENPIIIPVVNFQSFIQLQPHIRRTGSVLPGPFPDWLRNMANRSL